MKQVFLGLVLACTQVLPAHAALGPQALRLSDAQAAELHIDGRLDEAAWLQAPVFDRFVQFQPEDKKPAPWRTTVQVLASEDALIIGIRAYDPAPELIRAPLSRRDKIARDQDFVGVYLDPVGHRRSAQFARISAAGVLADGLIMAADDAVDYSPDFELQAAAQRLPDGYSVELRWPLAALRFPHGEGLPWRIMVVRNMPREEAATLVVSAPLDRESLSFIAELQVLEGLEDLAQQARERSFVSLRPELTLRQRRDQPGDGLPSHSQRELSLGAELKWRPRADWVIDATLNPDFSQVELDTPQLAGNTRYALSLPEKRAFFLESSDVVGQSLVDGNQHTLAAFYSRAITDPDWGLRATWRGARAEATALSVQDAGGGQVLRANAYGTEVYAQPGVSRASFVRGRQQLGQDPGQDLGLLLSERDYGGGLYNLVLGADGHWALNQQHQLRGQLLISSTSLGFDAQAQAQRMAAKSGHHLWLGWRQLSEDWSNTLDFEEVSPDFAHDNGFVAQAGYRRLTAHLARRAPGREWAPLGEWSRLPLYELEWQLMLQQSETLNDGARALPGGELIDRKLQPGLWFASARNSGVWARLGLDSQRAHSGGRLHAPRTVLIGFESMPNAWLSFLTAELEWGRRLDVDADRLGRGANLSIEAKLRLPSPKGLGLEWEQRWAEGFVDGLQGGRSLSDSNRQTILIFHLSARDSVRLIHQATYFERRAELGLFPSAEQTRHRSLVYQHRDGLERVFSLGLTQADESPRQARTTEVFAKALLAWQR